MLIPQITNEYSIATVILHGGNSERSERAFYWKADILNNLK
jgi:hypothetical protein